MEQGLKERTLREESTGFQAGERIALLSVWTLLSLGILEIVFAQFTGSIALLADGIDSLSDAAVSFFVWTGLHFALRRPSKRFPYGYYKVESLTALLAAVLLVGAASFIFLRSYRAIVNPRAISLPFIALVVLAIKGLKDLKLRRAGPFIVGILEVIVAGDMTVSEMHDVITELEHSIREGIPGLRSLTVKAIPS